MDYLYTLSLELNKKAFAVFLAIISEQLEVSPESVTFTSFFTDDLGADWTDMSELMMALEEKFEIEIPDQDAEKLRTAAWQYIVEHTKEYEFAKSEDITQLIEKLINFLGKTAP